MSTCRNLLCTSVSFAGPTAPGYAPYIYIRFLSVTAPGYCASVLIATYSDIMILSSCGVFAISKFRIFSTFLQIT